MKTIQQVLDEVNRIRKAHNWKRASRLLKGERFNGRQCPVARTVGHGCVMNTNYGITFDVSAMPSDSPAFERNPVLQEFGNDFDLGKYPELEIGD